MIELLTIYVAQADDHQILSMNAPNLHLFIPGCIAGLVMTIIVILVWIALYARKFKEFMPPLLLFCALASAVRMPFFPPKMHGRYFYPAEILAFLAACYLLCLWCVALGYRLVSSLVYAFVLTASVMSAAPALVGSLLILATLVNTPRTIYVFRTQWRVTNASDLDSHRFQRKAGIQAPG